MFRHCLTKLDKAEQPPSQVPMLSIESTIAAAPGSGSSLVILASHCDFLVALICALPPRRCFHSHRVMLNYLE